MYRFNLKLAITVLSLSVCVSVSANRCSFNVPSVDLDVCKTLNKAKSVKESPFYMNNPNSMCGLTFDLPGLPEFDASLGKYFKPIDGCKVIKAITGASAKADIKEAIKKVLDFKS